MILTLFGVLVFISLVLIGIGLIIPTESAQALIGFFLLFLLALVIINGGLEYESGAEISTSYAYSGQEVVSSAQNVTQTYSYFNDSTSRNVGYYMAIASAIGFIGVIYSLGRAKFKNG